MLDQESAKTDDGQAGFVAPNYENQVDFESLANFDQDFKECIERNHLKVDFKNPQHLRSLTKALLWRDFKIKLYLPNNRLCPPVPIRWLYVQWLQSLIDTTSPSLQARQNASGDIVGLDIGVGSSCIYPLLACVSRPTWKMFGTDIDETNYLQAVHNVSVNELDGRIKLEKTSSSGALIPLAAFGAKQLDFTMCNPPFFASKEEAQATYSKEHRPFAACTGADVEMITPGGEAEYVSRMIDESIVLRDKVQWYTVQLGKLVSVYALVQKLKVVECRNWVINVLQPSGQTVRWVLGWSWMAYRAPDYVARHNSFIGMKALLESTETIVAQESWDPSSFLLGILDALPLKVEKSMGEHLLMVLTESAVWSRQERRKRQKLVVQGLESNYQDTPSSPQSIQLDNSSYGFLITVVLQDTKDSAGSVLVSYTVHVRWIKGQDRIIYESFCGMMRRKIKEKSATISLNTDI